MLNLEADQVARLRQALAEAGYAHDKVATLLGPIAHRALARNETVPGLRATTGGSPLETLTRLWPLQAPVPEQDLERTLPGLVEPLCRAGILAHEGSMVRAAVDVRPYADDSHDWWVVSDLTPGLDGAQAPMDPHHVLGVSSASTSLAQLSVREPVDRAWDLGTGCGVQALHLSGHATQVVATDVNERALRMARLTAALNEVTVEYRSGSLFEPVAGELFDLVVTNPPFVVSPGTLRDGDERLVYRDSGLPGDEVVRRVVTGIPGRLTEGGWGQVLANWTHVEGQSWQERVGGWLEGLGCDAWVVQREVADPAEYVELWLKDAGLHGTADYTRRYDAWLSWFAEQRIDGVGFGWVNLRRTGRGELRLEEWPYEVEQPLGPEVAAWARRTDLLADRLRDSEGLLDRRLVLREDVRQETVGVPGAADPEVVLLRQQRGMRRARQVDTATAAAAGACDGDLPLGAILDAVATVLERPRDQVREQLVGTIRDLVADGFLGDDLR
ncbi:MAG TPA: methyltransferase [Nocardioidaceae bacterium]|nr:methyltransferase [Nocardioidaceae bacterium]